MSELGTPQDPLEVRCLSFGVPSADSPYLSIVAADGRQFCFGLRLPSIMLIRAQAQRIEDRWPAPDAA